MEVLSTLQPRQGGINIEKYRCKIAVIPANGLEEFHVLPQIFRDHQRHSEAIRNAQLRIFLGQGIYIQSAEVIFPDIAVIQQTSQISMLPDLLHAVRSHRIGSGNIDHAFGFDDKDLVDGVVGNFPIQFFHLIGNHQYKLSDYKPPSKK